METRDDITNGYEAQVHECENGIFNLVITLAKLKAEVLPSSAAYDEVSQYLRRLADGLTTVEQQGE